MSVHERILDLIGNTPLVAVRGLDTGPCRLLVKLESQNPGGSIKDRIGRSMIEAAEREGRIGPAQRSSKRPPATPAWGWRSSRRPRATG